MHPDVHYINRVSFEWFLARSELDIHCMGSLSCPSFLAPDLDRKEPQIHESDSQGPCVADTERIWTDAFDFPLGGVWLDCF